MENNFMLSEEMLWDYADGFLSEAEIRQVEAYLQQHPAQQARLQTIQAEKRAMAAMPLDKPRAGFADGVMAAWVMEQARKTAPVKQRDWILFTIAGIMGVLLVGALVLGVGMAPSMPALNIPDQYVSKVPTIDWATILDSAVLRYGLILMLAVLTLQFLDKYLQQRARLDTAL